MTDQKPKRKPAGAAVAGAVKRETRYPKTISLMVSNETYEAIEKAVQRTGKSKGEVLRTWIERGQRASRYR